MHYLEVFVADASYHGREALTYNNIHPLKPGQLVLVPLKRQMVLGVVFKVVGKPKFPTKPITKSFDLPPVTTASLETINWMRDYYPGPFGIITQLFLPKKIPNKIADITANALLPHIDLPALTTEQSAVIKQINQPGMYLLHGETGTGKTRVYIELAQHQFMTGRSVLILTPEIGLTSQLSRDFRQIFGDNVVVLHSKISSNQRDKIWVQLLRKQTPSVVIGARSALFSPLKTIGLIVVDESHEPAYKQDQMPYYHTNLVASRLGQAHKSIVLLGSATPGISDYYVATVKKRPILRMAKIAAGAQSEPKIKIIDIKDHQNFTKKSLLSDELIESIIATLKRGEQTILFLNRRGTARLIFCDHCGWQAVCPHCDLPLIYHGDLHTMRCHSCNFQGSSPASCPKCLNPTIIFKTFGTKAVVAEVERLFPNAKVQRFDTDNKKTERIEQHYEALLTGQIDIIVGTQTLAKGLDLPKLALVGIVLADTGLSFPDFSAQERTFQLLSQVMGRVNRGHRAGHIVIQTYRPDSELLKAILSKDWKTFYNQELKERRTYLFPPFCYLLRLTCRRASSRSSQAAAEKLALELKVKYPSLKIEGPTPSFHEKIQNKYEWQIIIKAKQRPLLIKIINQLPSGWSHDIDPINLL